ncbi:MAG: N-acetyltransferase [Deltaproteobacteria bacterium]|nr:N-acetyltransferase [Deltaproteobacteria bacterium]
MSKIQIVEVANDDKRGVKKFIDLAWRVFDPKEHPQWVPPLRMAVKESLDTKHNPFYKRCDIQLFIAEKDGKAVGRIAAIDNHAYNEFHKDKLGHYGFFESIDDQEVADALFNAAAEWVKKRGLRAMQGPMNPSTNHECGLLVRGQSQHPTIMTTWNPKYYETLHDKAGLKQAKDLVAYYLPTDKMSALPPKVVAYAERIKKESRISFRDFDVKNFQREVEMCFDIYNSAWEKNWGFFPMTREEFFFAAKDMKMLLDPNFAFIAEVDGKPAGFMLALPDINWVLKRIPNGKLFPTGIFKLLIGKKMLKTVRILTLGVKPEFRGGGIFAAFTYESFLRANRVGLLGGEASWILEDNVAMNKPWLDLGAPLYRRWRIYERNVQ